MTNPDYTHICVLVDQSGSMAPIKDDTEGAINAFVKDQNIEGKHTTLTLVVFDTKRTLLHDHIDIAEVPEFWLRPSGMTALLDAIGETVKDTGEWLGTLAEDERPGKVIFVIMTDGHENSSREYSQAAIAETIKHQSELYAWEFTYLGANQDAITVAQSMGIQAQHAMTYAAGNVGVAVGAASASVTRSRMGGDRSYTEAERAAVVSN